MSCCQGKRKQFHQSIRPESEPAPSSRFSQPAVSRTLVYFEYTGQTGLTAVGPITGKRYRFDRPGAALAVDGRDAPSLSAVPNLRRRQESVPSGVH
jgi:hypothetical protein